MNLREHKRYEVNPFLHGMAELMQIKYRNNNSSNGTTVNRVVNIIDEDTGEVTAGTIKYQDKKVQDDAVHVDRNEFRKIYIDGLSVIFSCSRTAQRVLLYFIVELSKDKDVVVFDMAKCRKLSGFSNKSSIYTGIEELLSRKILARSLDEGIYFINPMVIFNGNRFKIYNSFLRSLEDPIW